MQNVTMEVKGQELLIRIDLSKNCGQSKSGKSIIVGTTSGNADVPGHPGTKIGVNCYKAAR